MSSPTSSATTSSPTSSSSPSSNQLTSGTNYFFGFLIAFIAFLFVFLTLGLLARRRRMRLMREFLLYGPDDADLAKIPQTEPIMWQPVYTLVEPKLWNDVMPLAATWVRREVIEEPMKSESDATSSRWHFRNPFVVYFGFPAMKPSRKHRRRKVKVTEGLNVAVVINMPQAPDSQTEEEFERREYQIGMLQVPWKDDTLSQTPG